MYVIIWVSYERKGMHMWRLVNLVVTLSEAGTVTGDNTSGISDALETVKGIVNNVVLPIIYAVLGLFLVVKGALLGVQIVKAADEPQVRQEKIGSLKWLVIGIAIAFAVTYAAGLLTDYFFATFGGK